MNLSGFEAENHLEEFIHIQIYSYSVLFNFICNLSKKLQKLSIILDVIAYSLHLFD